jgi:tetratricopeptide (TPR) repeat protein
MWQNQRDVNAGIAEIYASFRLALLDNYFFWGEMRSDNFAMYQDTYAEHTKLVTNQLTKDLSCTSWASLYKTISNANFAIQNIPGANITDMVLKNDFLAQAYAMRALAYFYAVRVWGDVPVYLEPVDSFEKGEYKARTPKNEVLIQVILPDLKKAESLINPANVERKRISRYAIFAIMADVYMWLEDYENADQTLEKIVGNQTYNFQANMADLKKTFVELLNNRESDNNDPTKDEYGVVNELIFVIHQNSAEAGLNNFSRIWQVLGFGTGEGSAVVLSPALQTKYEQAKNSGDIRFDNYLMPAKSDPASPLQVHKYIANGTRIHYTEMKNCQMAYPIYRFTDVLLMQAEVKANLDKWQDALNILSSTVRTRAGVQASTRPLSSFSSRNELINYILDEKQLEQAGEGKRWFDLVRTKKVVEVMNPINGISKESQALFPIHQSIIDQNSELNQNEDY